MKLKSIALSSDIVVQEDLAKLSSQTAKLSADNVWSGCNRFSTVISSDYVINANKSIDKYGIILKSPTAEISNDLSVGYDGIWFTDKNDHVIGAFTVDMQKDYSGGGPRGDGRQSWASLYSKKEVQPAGSEELSTVTSQIRLVIDGLDQRRIDLDTETVNFVHVKSITTPRDVKLDLLKNVVLSSHDVEHLYNVLSAVVSKLGGDVVPE